MRLRSHQRAAAALDADKFKDETVAVECRASKSWTKRARSSDAKSCSIKTKACGAIRRAEGLAKLKPAFHVKGTITAGNASQMSDGAAAAIVMSDARARRTGRETDGAVRCVCNRGLSA